MITPGQLWYGQHFICYRQLFKKTTTQAVFEYIADEYTRKAKGDGICYFELKRNDIRVKLGMAWDTIQEHLALLRKMGIIDYTEDADWECTIREARLISLLCTIADNKTEAKKRKFKDALEAGDEDTLVSLGYHFHPEYEGMLKKLSGSPFGVKLGKLESASRNGESYPKSENLIRNLTTLSEKPQPYQISDNIIKNVISLSDISQGYQISDKFWSKCNRFANDLASQICENLSKKSLSYQISDKFSQLFDNPEDFDRFLDDLYSGEQMAYSPILFLLAGELGFFTKSYQKSDKEIIKFLNHYINNNKREVTSLSSQEEIEDNQEKEGNMENSSFSDNNGFEEIELLPAIKINQEAINRSKRRDNLPFLTSSEMDMFTQSPDLVVDRPDALFIFQLWTILKEHFTQDVEDEDGNISEKQVNPDGQYIPVEVFLKNILGPAFDAAEDAIRMGKLECEKGTFQLSIPQDFQLSVDDMFMIPDFNRMKTDDDDYFQISYDRFHDITAKDTEESGKPEGMRESEYNKRYLQEIVKTEDDEDRFSQLTDMEYFVYVFLGQYFKIDDTTKEIIDVLDEYQDRKYVTGRELARYFMEHTEVSKDDFLSILKTPLNEGALDLKPVGLFSADKIRKWNRLHKQKSIIEI